MKSFTKTRTNLAVLAVTLGTALFGAGGSASAAACQWQYSSNGMTTSQTPVFNSICNVPNGVGDETDWVRVRQSTNGNDMDNQNNPDFVDSLGATCNVGELYDVHYYIHNDAMPDFNNNGSGTAVAHNVQLAMSAPLNTTASNFTFGGKITASNAASVSDTANVNCGSKQVQLTLVPSSVHLYSSQYGWKDLSNSAVNGSSLIGSPTFGSGDQWGCWDYRVVVVYQVKVTTPPPPPQVTATCDLLDIIAADNRTVKVNAFNFTAKNTTFKNVALLWDASNAAGVQTLVTDATQVVGQTHQYSADGTYLVKAVVSFTNPDSTADGVNCEKQVTFSSTPPKVTPPPSTPQKLVNTGAGSIVGLFAAATVAGSAFYRWMLGRRLTDR